MSCTNLYYNLQYSIDMDKIDGSTDRLFPNGDTIQVLCENVTLAIQLTAYFFHSYSSSFCLPIIIPLLLLRVPCSFV